MSRLPTKKKARRFEPSLGDEVLLKDKPTTTPDSVPRQSTRKPAATEVRSKVDRVLARFAPAHVVVNDAHEVVQFHGNAGRYFELAPGRASLNLLAMLREGLIQPLETTLRAAGQRGAVVRRRNVKFKTNSGYETIDIEVTPLQAHERKDWFVVVFQSAADHLLGSQLEESSAGSAKSPARTGVEVTRLRHQLAHLRESLRIAAQQHERTNGELHAANEEVQTANEELQSINEELESSREQLQTSNDELLTVNDALLSRSVALAADISELQSMLASTQIAVVIIDRESRVRRFTPLAKDVFNVLAADAGRHLHDLKLAVSCSQLQDELRDVLDRGAVKHFDVQDKNGRHYSLRLRPYLSEENSIEGAAIIAIDRD